LVPYTPDWEPLAAALKRVVGRGVAEQQAKADICHAVADGKIRIRVVMHKTAPDVGGQTLEGRNVGVPLRLDPADFDWANSRPFAPWDTGPNFRNPAERYFALWPWKPRAVALIELSVADLTDVLCRDEPSGQSEVVARQIEVATFQSDGTKPKTSRRGPAPNTVDRYGASDRALFDDLERIMRDTSASLRAAATQLADAGRIAGAGSPESRATRLARRYKAERARGN
jgi:hypothetical protein